MFFFSSRRRHTRFDCDWSSDVCSSDLSNRELQKIEPRSHHAETLILNANAEVASVSPDGHLALYTDRPDGSLWRSSIDGAQRLRLTKPPLVASAPHWSRDGKQILFTGARPGSMHQIYFLSADGDRKSTRLNSSHS